MAIRVPPGRAGRLWLLRRLAVARRGAEVLEQKRGTLLRERLRLASQLAEATANWERTSRAASAWNARVSAAAGPRVIRLAALDTGKATVTISWRNVLGVVVPVSAKVEDEGRPAVGVARGAAVALATEAHAEALSAAASLAALSAAHEAIEAELRRTIRRLRAIEQRWIPAHEAELRRLELVLEENELADIVRVRWAVSRQR